MIGFLTRCAFAFVALTSIPFSLEHEHVDVRVNSACIEGVSRQVTSGDAMCIYRDVSLRGHVITRDFDVSGPTGIGFLTKDAMIESQSNDMGLTWRSVVLLLGAIAMWAPSLVSLFAERRPRAAGR